METTSSTKTKNYDYIAFFDLDRTITKAISGRVLAREAFKKGLMKRSDLGLAAYYGLAYRLGLADPVTIMEKMTLWVKGLSVSQLNDLCIESVNNAILSSIYSEVKDELQMHRTKNARTIILSATLELICKEVANHLEIDDYICSSLEVKNGYLTGRPEGKLCYGEEKLKRLKDYCEKNNSKIEDAWYYGDAFSDLPALALVGHPVCINPERKLYKEAIRKGWRISNWG